MTVYQKVSPYFGPYLNRSALSTSGVDRILNLAQFFKRRVPLFPRARPIVVVPDYQIGEKV
jgi:hypothetical protein